MSTRFQRLPVVCLRFLTQHVTWDVRSGLVRTFPSVALVPALTKNGDLLLCKEGTNLYKTDREVPPTTLQGWSAIPLPDGRMAVLEKKEEALFLYIEGELKAGPFALESFNPPQVLPGVLLLGRENGSTLMYSSLHGETYPISDYTVKPSPGRFFLLVTSYEFLLVDEKGKTKPAGALTNKNEHFDRNFAFIPRLEGEPDLVLSIARRGPHSRLLDITGVPKVIANLALDADDNCVMGRGKDGAVLIQEGTRSAGDYSGGIMRRMGIDGTTLSLTSLEGMTCWTGEGFVTLRSDGGLVLFDDSYKTVLETSSKISERRGTFADVVIPKREREAVKRMAREMFDGMLIGDLASLVGSYV